MPVALYTSKLAWVPWGVSLALGMVPIVAEASAAPAKDTGQNPLFALLLGIAVVAAAYLFAHFVVRTLKQRYLLTTGLEYLAVGVLLGPAVPAIPAFSSTAFIEPLAALAVGWVGLLHGLSFKLGTALSTRDRAWRLTLANALAATLLAAAMYGFLVSGMVGPTDTSQALLPAGMLGFASWAGSQAAFDTVASRYPIVGSLGPTLQHTGILNDVLAVFGFGLLFAVFHEPVITQSLTRPPTPIEWAGLSILLGLGFGGIFSYYLTNDESKVLLVLVGVISLAVGAAFFLDLSPLLICLVMGVVLVNTNRSSPQIDRALKGTEHPVALLLLILAGVLWSPPPWVPTLALAALYTIVRAVGNRLFLGIASIGTELRSDLYRAFVGHGDVVIAMAVSFRLVFHPHGNSASEADLFNTVYSALLLVALLHEMAAPRMLKGLLVDAQDIEREPSRTRSF